MDEKGIAGEWLDGAAHTVNASASYRRARISFELHVCVKWMRMPYPALELLEGWRQTARLVVRLDPQLRVERVQHP